VESMEKTEVFMAQKLCAIELGLSNDGSRKRPMNAS
jgi:hypothetical protein